MMRAAVLFGPRDLRLVNGLPTPAVEQPDDAVVEVTVTAICGSDLHPYRGEIEGFRAENVMGHEFVGRVVEAGPAVCRHRPGDRVFASDLVACGRCDLCRRGWHYHCPRSTLFGYGDVVGDYLPGGQAELVRVPFADLTLGSIPRSVSDEQALFACDVMTTAWTACEHAGVAEGSRVAVVGCGPVGLCAIQAARHAGARQVVALDPDRRRRRQAKSLGAEAVPSGPGAGEAVRDLTGGGADAVIEAVGTGDALSTAVAVAAIRGTICVVGAHGDDGATLAARTAFVGELSLRFMVGDPLRDGSRVLDLIAAGALDPSRIVSHRLPLDRAAEGYRLFDRREATKVVFHVVDEKREARDERALSQTDPLPMSGPARSSGIVSPSARLERRFGAEREYPG